jgi:hypothetical protein
MQYSKRMERQSFHIHNRLISWDDETHAINSIIIVDCPRCVQKFKYIPTKQGLGELVELQDLEIANYQKKKLLGFSEYYHAPVRLVHVSCPNNHDVRLFIIFGETQPARYVFVYIGVLSVNEH